MNTFILGSRQSPLALWQTNRIIDLIRQTSPPDWNYNIEDMPTFGDMTNEPIDKLETTGVFTKELEKALLSGRIDMAVHSLKDVATRLPQGLILGAVTERADYRDALVSDRFAGLTDLPGGARLGTGSPRRAAQLKAFRPDLEFVPIRGNIDTRLGKMRSLGLHGLILAAAGLDRLGYGELIRERISPEICLPAPGQGALCVEVWEGNPRFRELSDLLSPIGHAPTTLATQGERLFMAAVGGGCSSPVGALGIVDEGADTITLMGAIPRGEGKPGVRGSITGSTGEIPELARQLADMLAKDGRSG